MALAAIIVCSPLRFDYEPANWWVMFAVGLGVPWWLMAGLLRMRRGWSDPLSAFLAPALAMFTVMMLFADINVHPMPLRSETEWDGSKVRLYSNHWGTAAEIRQERPLVPGVRMVRQLLFLRGCAGLRLERTDNGVRVRSTGACGEIPAAGLDVTKAGAVR